MEGIPIGSIVVRQMALVLFRREKTETCGIKTKRMRAGRDNDYPLKVPSV